jgi:uncharacterized protein (TIGR02646 family)
MRPVHKGTAPDHGFSEYRDAFPLLRDRIGPYCSYCERQLPVSLAIEHLVPKSREPGLALQWENFLLGCTNCNSTKGNKPVNPSESLWPDRDHTMLAFVYREGGFVEVADGLAPEAHEMAVRLKDLVGLDRHPGGPGQSPTHADERWRQREEIFKLAQICRERLKELDRVVHCQELIVDVARHSGFFSVWMTVFEHDSEMRRRFIAAFPGTCGDCFDPEGNLIRRPGGRL